MKNNKTPKLFKVVKDMGSCHGGTHVFKPLWQSKVEDFVSGIKDVPFFKSDGNPDKSWKVFYGDTWDAARGAAWDAAWGAAWGAARGAAWDAALYASLFICDDLKLSKKHRDYIEKRWGVWKNGYA